MPEYIPRQEVVDCLKRSWVSRLRELGRRCEEGDPRVIKEYEHWVKVYDRGTEREAKARERMSGSADAASQSG